MKVLEVEKAQKYQRERSTGRLGGMTQQWPEGVFLWVPVWKDDHEGTVPTFQHFDLWATPDLRRPGWPHHRKGELNPPLLMR